ncbi:FtsX-like permease family protein [Streptomyces sp. NPDC008121]|uniref:FtsX-like permease family protein n=1 Tax=Streptomyces sp. NPDC008121 TaxID=3364809 RepID=UPI0036ECAAEE
MTGFVLLRVRAHRLLLAAALLAVLLTTSVLASLAAFSGSVGDAALQGTLRGRSAPAAALVVTAQVPPAQRASADAAARDAARRTFDDLPVSVRKLERSGPYALPRSLQDPARRLGEPDLTHVAALDRSRLALVEGAWPTAGPGAAGEGGRGAAGAVTIEVALPEEAARRLRTGPGTVLDLADRLGGKPVRARVTGIYRPRDLTDLYWQLDPAGGRGVRTVVFTTYGPLLADPAVLGSGRLTSGETRWLATADFTGVTTGRMDALSASATAVPPAVAADTARFGGTVSARTSLPTVLAQTDRALVVSRSTLLIVAVQLVLLAAYTLLLVARLLSSERTGETELLRARGGSRRRIAGLAAVEALLLALPAAVIAPLLAGPLTRLLAERSALGSLGVRLDDAPAGQVWLVAALVAVCCAAAVVAPALAARDGGVVSLRRGRAAALPAPVRAGADIGLLVVAAVAYWQLDRQTGAGGPNGAAGSTADPGWADPMLVAAPALALLAGTVLTLRLLPPAARLAERRAAGGRGLPAALAGWQFSRRPLRGAGPVLLLVLAVAMGMLAIGQSASWDRSQQDQADFRTGTSVRVLTHGSADPAAARRYTSLPGVRSAAPAHRATTDFADNRTATVLALDTRSAAGGALFRSDLADRPASSLLTSLAPRAGARPGLPGTLPGVATDAFLAAAGAKKGDRVEVSVGGATLKVTLVDTVRQLPTTGVGAQAVSATEPAATPDDGGALLVDLHAAQQYLAAADPAAAAALAPTEWWLTTAPGRTGDVTEALRARPDADPAQVLVRDEAAAELLGDPLGAGPNSALMAVAGAAAALAAVGFAVSAAGSTRERSAEFAVLRALGAPRRQLARLIAAEQGLLVGIGLLVGVALGTVLTRTVVPLVVLTGQATQPVPRVLVQLPPGHVALLLAGVALLPLLIVTAIALRRTDPAVSLRHQGDH